MQLAKTFKNSLCHCIRVKAFSAASDFPWLYSLQMLLCCALILLPTIASTQQTLSRIKVCRPNHKCWLQDLPLPGCCDRRASSRASCSSCGGSLCKHRPSCVSGGTFQRTTVCLGSTQQQVCRMESQVHRWANLIWRLLVNSRPCIDSIPAFCSLGRREPSKEELQVQIET